MKKLLSLLLSVMICLSFTGQMVAYAAEETAPQQVYQSIISLQNQYPEGMSWTNENYYEWQGGIYSGGHGCAGFAFMLSDAAFGDLPARMIEDFTFTDVQVGDILRINNDTHSVIVLEVNDNSVVIAEGNFNNSVHWGRILTKDDVLSADYMITRYPDPAISTSETDPSPSIAVDLPADEEITDPSPDAPVEPYTPETPSADFTDVAADAFYAAPVAWAVEQNITKGTSATTFSPNGTCKIEQILTFLWRAAGSPASAAPCPFAGLEQSSPYYPALCWASEKGILLDEAAAAGKDCTRIMAVEFMHRYAGSPESITRIGFLDVPGGQMPAVLWAIDNGVTNGTGNGNFSPEKTCTRGEIVTFLYRAFSEK